MDKKINECEIDSENVPLPEKESLPENESLLENLVQPPNSPPAETPLPKRHEVP